MDRYWLLTWTMYGNWLPGDDRGFVGTNHEEGGPRVIHNIPQTDYDANQPALRKYAKEQLKCPPIRLCLEQAEVLLAQFQQTAAFRQWQLIAVAIMVNHVHIVVGVPGDPDPEKILGDFKAYGSRVLSQLSGKPKSGTWWTESGSKRKLKDDVAILGAVEYVKNQFRPLVVWVADGF